MQELQTDNVSSLAGQGIGRTIFAIGLLSMFLPGVSGIAGEAWQQPFEPDEHTLALYHFDEGKGSVVADCSRSNNDGKLYGMERKPVPLWVEGKFGRGLEFGGRYDWVDVPDKAVYVGMSQLTVEAWVYIYNPRESASSANSSLGEIVSTPGYSLRMNPDASRIEFVVFTDGPEGKNKGQLVSAPIKLEEWIHVAGTYDGKCCHIFIDGKPAESGKSSAVEGRIKAAMKGRDPDRQLDSPSVFRRYSPVSIGGGVNLLNGIIDEVRISDCARYGGRE